MKKLLFLMAVVLSTAVVVRRLVPSERRTQLRESLTQMPMTMMERRMESMPEDSPPKVLMSTMRRFEEQNKLLRKQNNILQEATSAGESQG